ncbi:hypothetical protein [Kribbella sp. VKM Ac-2568]|uniref:hypothetical protein n=1 Tax=Kribbella sp. VKM Ac-2568 TaxID=2512219 RepID=UPI001051D9B2|nr:hypothetical protein [Kribbella sp. VKM Ac-2568]TCM45013.1 hypothetical protein EV648_107165 [Kribbella sp. VKM Ac-2568]
MTTAPTNPNPSQVAPQKRPWSAWRTLLIILGSVLVLLGGCLLVGGGIGLWAHQQRDGDGYYTAGPEQFQTDTSALSVPSIDVDLAGPQVGSGQGMLGKIRIRAEMMGADTPLFLGIGPSAEVAKYLEGVGHDELSDIDVDPFKATYTTRPGTDSPADPAGQSFWVASDSGTGPRTLVWDVADGDWTILIMNADGSSGIDASVSAAAKLPIILPIAIGALIAGGTLLLIGLLMIVLPIAVRGNSTPAPRPTTGPRPM